VPPQALRNARLMHKQGSIDAEETAFSSSFKIEIQHA
jgi:hypothetical protein